MKNLSILLLIFCIIFTTHTCYAQNLYLEHGNVSNIKISVTISPIKDSKYCYEYSTNNTSEIAYIVHYLNSFDLIDDGKNYGGGDIPIVNIDLIRENGSLEKMGFFDGRFCDVNDKQYAVDRSEYQQFLDFVYALKMKALVLDDVISFEPSNWAKSYIDEAIANNLVLRRNQIAYTSKITREESCELIYSLLKAAKLLDEDTSAVQTQFTDTNSSVVCALLDKGIVYGKSESEFCPYDFITREELATILNRVYNFMDDVVQSQVDDNIIYKDQTEFSSWAFDSIYNMSSLQIMIGDENNEFRPKDYVVKEEEIVAILRLFDLYADSPIDKK